MMTPGIFSAALLAAASALPAAAQTTPSSPLVTQVTMADLQSIVEEMGHSVEAVEDQVVFAKSSDDLFFSVMGAACANDVCRGVNMAVTYDRQPGDTPDDINRADIQFAAVSVWYNEDSIGVSRYLILDNGISRENLKYNLEVLLNISANVISSIGQEPAPAPVILPKSGAN